MNKINKKELIIELFERFSNIGINKHNGTIRLGYEEDENLMHNEVQNIASEFGLNVYVDEVGNTFVSNVDWKEDAFLIGSHLDSVIDGGHYDGVAGIIAGLVIAKTIIDENLNIPVKIGAFRCEESSNFQYSTIGSSMITKKDYWNNISSAKSLCGKNIDEIYTERNFSRNPELITNIKGYLELHIEQGRVLEEADISVGIVNKIAGYKRFRVNIKGLSEHSGGTPMNIRKDALCCAAEIILGVENLGSIMGEDKIVATVGEILNTPNVMNVVPGETELYVDIRGIDEDQLLQMAHMLVSQISLLKAKRKLEIEITQIAYAKPINMSENYISQFKSCAKNLNFNEMVLTSGAGHDAMNFVDICETGMIFIPCKNGVSHNREEEISLDHLVSGVDLMMEFLKEKNNASN